MIQTLEKNVEKSWLLEPKHFYRRLERIFSDLETLGPSEWFARAFISRFFEEMSGTLQLQSIQLYDRLSGNVKLLSSYGFIPFAAVQEIGTMFQFKIDFPWIGRFAGQNAAVLPVGENETLMMAFFAKNGNTHEDASFFQFAFSSLHYMLLQHLRHVELLDSVEQARAIQMSLLPSQKPDFGMFDIAARSVPAEQVGGDLYDFQHSGEDTLAITIADAAGHGLAAALQARDVITGIRMSGEAGWEITRTVETLNRVIHRSGLASRFVSMVFCQLDSSGNFCYVNAGHPRPLLADRSGIQELDVGGMILGPRPELPYLAGNVRIEPETMLVLYSDGVVERMAADGSEFGIERLKQWLLETRNCGSEEAINDLFVRLDEFGDHEPLQDDATVVLIRRPLALV